MAVRLLQWNANGILAHCQEFQQSLATLDFDIICIQESFLKPDKEGENEAFTAFYTVDVGRRADSVDDTRHVRALADWLISIRV